MVEHIEGAFVLAFAVVAFAFTASFGVVYLNNSLEWGLPMSVVHPLEVVRNFTFLIVAIVAIFKFTVAAASKS